MGNVKSAKSRRLTSKQPPPTSLVLDLHAPGMTLMHRAGLGGLAATLRAMERRHKHDLLSDDDLPGGPDLGDGYPWRIKPTRITLDWGEPTAAGEYFKRLFAFAFGIKDKLIDLPGTYRTELSRAVRAELQKGIETTFLTHGPTAGSRAGISETSLEIEGVPFRIRHTIFTSYRHQGWYWLEREETEEYVDPKTGKKNKRKTGVIKKNQSVLEMIDKAGAFVANQFAVDKKMFPGAVSRHSGLGASTAISENERNLLCLYFAMVGCLCFQGPRKMVRDKRAKKRVPKTTGVLVVPEVADLSEFARIRPRMTPTGVRACRMTGASDAALQAMVQLRLKRLAGRHTLDGVYSVHLAPTDWGADQVSRINTVYVSGQFREEDYRLNQFEIALSHLPPHVWSKEVPHDTGRGKKKVTTKSTEWFWVDSVVRPLIADNLANDKRWYDNFVHLMRDRDDNQFPLYTRVRYEMKGLQAMADEPELSNDAEMRFIYALHRVIAIGHGRIYEELGRPGRGNNGRYPSALTNRWERFRERLRLALINAKTDIQTQDAISMILARAGIVSELRDNDALRQIKSLVFGAEWRRARDLALFALASYKKPANVKELPSDTEGLEETASELVPETDAQEPTQ